MADAQRFELVKDIRGIVSELMRLAQFYSTLREERALVAIIQAGVEHCVMAGREDAADIFVHNKLLGISEESQQGDMTQIVDITKFLGSSRSDAGANMSMRGTAVQPIMMAPHLQAPGGGGGAAAVVQPTNVPHGGDRASSPAAARSRDSATARPVLPVFTPKTTVSCVLGALR